MKLFGKKSNFKTKFLNLDETVSTNDYLRSYTPGDKEEMTVVSANYQTGGRGQGTNKWESEEGQNLLFSILLHPNWLAIGRQFVMSMAEAMAIKEVLDEYTDGITVKWPNDIYYKDYKIGGTLIETKISSGHINDFIIGTGLNINQEVFRSDAPNPISLKMITGKTENPEKILKKIIEKFDENVEILRNGGYGEIAEMYHACIYRRDGFHKYRDKDGEFEAAFVEVEDSGRLILRDHEGVIRDYMFKEVEFII